MSKTGLFFLLVFFGVFFVLATSLKSTPSADKTYASDFIARIEKGEIVKVILTGSHVAGVSKTGATARAYMSDASRAKLIETLISRGVAFEEIEPPQTGAVVSSLISLAWLGVIIFFGYRLIKGTGSTMNGIAKFASSRATLHMSGVKTTFADVAGIDGAVEELRDVVDFLKDTKRFTKLGGRIPKGVLLIGPPGTGKTLLARAVAGEAGVPFFSATSTSFVEMFVGVGASRVRDLFQQAQKRAPCIIFIDEIDSAGKKRAPVSYAGGHDERESTLNQILTEMDGFSGTVGIVVIAATNRPDVLDEALVRPGRFDRHVYLTAPDLRAREAILRVLAKKISLAPGVDLNEIARGTPGMTGAGLEDLLNEAALAAAKASKDAVDAVDLEDAREKIVMGKAQQMILSPKERRMIAFHESGHTAVAKWTPLADPPHKVTIIPRGRSLGSTQSMPLEDRRIYTARELEAQIMVLLGGRAAEELFCGEKTTGASDDLERASGIARKMVTFFGMDPLFGLCSFENETRVRDVFNRAETTYSEETAARIDKAVSDLIVSCYERAETLLKQNESGVKQLAAELMEREMLDAADIARILGDPTST